MHRVLNTLRLVVTQFGTLATFNALLYSVGLKAAIAGAIVFALADAVRRLVGKIGFPRLYVLTTMLTLVFGGIDLLSKTPFMIQYEGVITSLVLAISFAYGAQGPRPMLQSLAEEQTGQSFPDRPDLRAFFKLLTLAWAGYFALRAGVYFWLGQMLPIEQTMKIRPVLGVTSLAIMLAISFQGRRLFPLLQRLGLLPAAAPQSGS